MTPEARVPLELQDRSNAFLQIEPRLVDDAVFHAMREHPAFWDFDRERLPLYTISDPEERERRFRKLHAAWFSRLDLPKPLNQALDEQPTIKAYAAACLVARAGSARVEGADLHVTSRCARDGTSTLVVRLCPETFGDPDRLLAFLRHELQHVADILDPHFDYEPHIPVDEVDPSRQRMILDRYTILWNITIAGRLSRQGRSTTGAAAARRHEFNNTFRMLGESGSTLFKSLFAEESPTHARLAAIARDPESALRSTG